MPDGDHLTPRGSHHRTVRVQVIRLGQHCCRHSCPTSASTLAVPIPATPRVTQGWCVAVLRTDPAAAIGKAKNLVEATAKAVLVAHRDPMIGHNMDKLVNRALRLLGLEPDPHGKSTEAEVMRLLKQRSTSVIELRNLVGNGHAKETALADVDLRYGHLVVRAALAWCSFVLATLPDQQVRLIE